MRELVIMTGDALGMSIEFSGEGLDTIGVDLKTGKQVIAIDPRYYRPTEVEYLLGDPAKAKSKLGWSAKTSFEELVREMVEHDIKLTERDALCTKEGFKTYSFYE